MKLRKAHVKNFRLLKDLVLDFSIDEAKPLTVIRAANETGKTTTENALIWCFYGSDALPGKGKKYPLYPSDSVYLGADKIEIEVEIEFETSRVINAGRPSQKIENKIYRLLRTCVEKPTRRTGNVERESEKAILFEVTPTGADQVESHRVRQIIEDSIPRSLKDVYFTDGDSVMSFIEAAATTGVKRQRVRDAVESLLGLETLEKTIKHVDLVARKFSSEIDNTDYSKELERLNDILEGLEEDIKEWTEKHKTLELEKQAYTVEYSSVSKKIDELLKLGDKAKLKDQVKRTKSLIDQSNKAALRSLARIGSITRSKDLAISLVSKVGNNGFQILDNLSQKKQLPKVSVPILDELLTRKKCFCGENIAKNTDEGKKRRKYIKEAIKNSLEADELSEAATALFYSVRNYEYGEATTEKWLDEYRSFSMEFAEKSNQEQKAIDDLATLEEEIDKIKDDKLEYYRDKQKALREQIDRSLMQISSLATKIKEAEEKWNDRQFERNKTEKKLHKTGVSTSKLDASRLCSKVLSDVFNRMRTQEVTRVSEEMNRIFLNMIGSNPDTNEFTLITKAELTDEFDIIVYGQKGHRLNPDTDLNGASRRAITLAFILALTKVSRVEAPNVIDTPLGMMSGYVKQSVLMQTLKEGTQVILFLTHDEIKGVENIISNHSGKIYTLTNPAHYPEMLVNKPNVSDARIIRCECDHNSSCSVCSRKEIELAG